MRCWDAKTKVTVHNLFKGIVSLYKGRVLLKHLKSTAKRDEYGRHASASAIAVLIMP